MNDLPEALGLALAMGAVILFCRAFPFLFFAGKKSRTEDPANLQPDQGGRTGPRAAFFVFVEKIVPPVAMTVLAFNTLGTSFRDNQRDGLLVLAASVFTALVHIWKRNPLISIFGGTALYMILLRVFVGN